MKKLASPLLLISSVIAAPLAHAHHDMSNSISFSQGLLHPLTGIDHLLVMLAIGCWAMQQGGRAIWQIPSTFVSVMLVAAYCGTQGVSIPFMEQGILLSICATGILLAAAKRLPLWMASLCVASFAGLHGLAHGQEMPLQASGLSYAAGFVLCTVLLHLAGLAIAKFSHHALLRVAGGILAVLASYWALV